MSKLAHAINDHMTGDHKLKRLKFVNIKHDVSAVPASMIPSVGVNIQATFQHTVWVDDHGGTSARDKISGALHDTKRAIIEDVFGEFRPLILEMRTALYDIDTDRLRSLLVSLEHQMFVDGM